MLAMRIIFSRKGFDSGFGKRPSPIVEGRPISLPIPTSRRSATRYADIGLGSLVETVTKGNLQGSDLCHHDPYFAEGFCALGQCSSAQGHLANNGVGPGDVFLFFGLFADLPGGKPHHRIFGYMRIEEMQFVGPAPVAQSAPAFAPDHPHFIGDWGGRDANNTLYLGRGAQSRRASSTLRLTAPEGPTSMWQVPSWLHDTGLTYHSAEWRWPAADRLQSVAKGQEFIANIDDHGEARSWLDSIIAEIEQ